MRINRIVVENFRSIQKVDFKPGPFCSLIGENNAGKSTILRALNLVLGEQFPTERSFEEDDFHGGNTTSPIAIEIHFDEPWDESRSSTGKVGGFRIECKAYKKKTKDKVAGELHTDFYCLDELGQPAGDTQGTFYGANLRVTGAMRERAPLLYVDVLRDYSRHQPSTRWSMLRRIVDQLAALFKNDKTTIKVMLPDGTTKGMSREEAYQHHMNQAFHVLQTDGLRDLQDKLERNALEQMGLDAGAGEIRLHFSGYDPAMAFRNLELVVEQLGITSRAEDVGAGLQSAIVVAIFRTYEELRRGGAIFAIEEPEAFLHPQKARYFADVLERISEAGNQVLLATHSPYFAKLHDPQSLGVVRRDQPNGTRVIQATTSSIAPDLKSILKIQAQVNAERSEMLFARRVLLVEGQTERLAIPFVLEAMGVDANREGITVVDCDSKTAIPFFAGLARTFEIPFVVLADLDPAQDQKATKELQAACSPEDLFLLDPDFEGVCGYSAPKREKLTMAHKHFSQLPSDAIPQTIGEAVERLVAK